MARDGAERLSARGLDVLLLPPLALTPAPFASEFAGTVDAPSEAITLQITGVVRSLGAHGIRVIAIANAHHDPAHIQAVRLAVSSIAARGYGTLVFPDLTKRRWAEQLTPEFRSGACHAGRYEGSIVLAERADLVRRDIMITLPPNPRSIVEAMRRGDVSFTQAGGPDAYFGFPADASEEEGRQIVQTLGMILEQSVIETLSRDAGAHAGEPGDVNR
jgi:creatinine amidohydrolase